MCSSRTSVPRARIATAPAASTRSRRPGAAIGSCAGARYRRRSAGGSLPRAAERVARARIARPVPLGEPVLAFLGRAVRAGLRVDLSLELLLEPVVADRRGGGQGIGDIAVGDPRDESGLYGVRRPHARVAIGLQLEPHRRARRALTVRPTSVDRSLEVLDVMPVFVREDVRLRERTTRRAEAGRELPEEPEIDVHVLVGGAVEGTDRGGGDAAARLRAIGEQHGARLRVAGQCLRPVVLDAVHVRDDRAVLALLRVRTGAARRQVARGPRRTRWAPPEA